jgi:hypothetical protein
VLNPETPIAQNKYVLRATALDILGEAYMAVQKDTPSVLESGYVHVKTNSRDNASYSS